MNRDLHILWLLKSYPPFNRRNCPVTRSVQIAMHRCPTAAPLRSVSDANPQTGTIPKISCESPVRHSNDKNKIVNPGVTSRIIGAQESVGIARGSITFGRFAVEDAFASLHLRQERHIPIYKTHTTKLKQFSPCLIMLRPLSRIPLFSGCFSPQQLYDFLALYRLARIRHHHHTSEILIHG